LSSPERDAAAAGQPFIDHCDRGAPLGIAIGRFDLKINQDGVAIPRHCLKPDAPGTSRRASPVIRQVKGTCSEYRVR